MYCGEFGHWPPYLTGDRGFTTVLKALSRGIVQTQAAIADVDAAARFMHVEASFRFAGDLAAHPETVEHLQERAYIVQDLVMGRVDDAHPRCRTCSGTASPTTISRGHGRNIADPDVVGVNYYPQHSTELFEDGVVLGGGPGALRPRLNAWTEGLKDVLTSFARPVRQARVPHRDRVHRNGG